MKLYKFVNFILLLALSTNALAICEQERREYSDWNSKCETLSTASQITGTAGGIFALVTFGASMIPCAAAIAAAQNACRIRDEKKQNLERCEAYQANLVRQAQEAAQAALAAQQAEEARQNRITQINADFGNRRNAIIQQYDRMIQDFLNNFVAEGWDIDALESQELIRTTRANMERERDQRLDQLETERRQTVANA